MGDSTLKRPTMHAIERRMRSSSTDETHKNTFELYSALQQLKERMKVITLDDVLNPDYWPENEDEENPIALYLIKNMECFPKGEQLIVRICIFDLWMNRDIIYKKAKRVQHASDCLHLLTGEYRVLEIQKWAKRAVEIFEKSAWEMVPGFLRMVDGNRDTYSALLAEHD